MSDFLLLSWLGIVGLLVLGCYLLLRGYLRADPTPAEAPRWGDWFLIGVGLPGLSWGAVGGLLFPEQSYAHQAFIGFVLAGISAAAVSTLSSFPGAYHAFLLPAILHTGTT